MSSLLSFYHVLSYPDTCSFPLHFIDICIRESIKQSSDLYSEIHSLTCFRDLFQTDKQTKEKKQTSSTEVRMKGEIIIKAF